MSHFAFLGDHPRITVYGLVFADGNPTEVLDPHAIAKLRGNREFAEVIDGVQVIGTDPPPKRRGRPPKAR